MIVLDINDPDFKEFLEKAANEQEKAERSERVETLVMILFGGALAYWAFRSIAHSFLFGFITYAVCSVGNRINAETRNRQFQTELEKWRS